VAQVVEGLPSQHKALSSNPSTAKKKKKKKKKKQKDKRKATHQDQAFHVPHPWPFSCALAILIFSARMCQDSFVHAVPSA
jgi:hypothetical protein